MKFKILIFSLCLGVFGSGSAMQQEVCGWISETMVSTSGDEKMFQSFPDGSVRVSGRGQEFKLYPEGMVRASGVPFTADSLFLAVTSDKKFVALLCADSKVRVWDVESRRLLTPQPYQVLPGAYHAVQIKSFKIEYSRDQGLSWMLDFVCFREGAQERIRYAHKV